MWTGRGVVARRRDSRVPGKRAGARVAREEAGRHRRYRTHGAGALMAVLWVEYGGGCDGVMCLTLYEGKARQGAGRGTHAAAGEKVCARTHGLPEGRREGGWLAEMQAVGCLRYRHAMVNNDGRSLAPSNEPQSAPHAHTHLPLHLCVRHRRGRRAMGASSRRALTRVPQQGGRCWVTCAGRWVVHGSRAARSSPGRSRN